MQENTTLVQESIDKFNDFVKTSENISTIAFEGYELKVLSHNEEETVLINEYMDDDCGCYHEDEYILSTPELNYYILQDLIHDVLVKEKTKLIDVDMKIIKMLFPKRAYLLESGEEIEFPKVYEYITKAVFESTAVEFKEHSMNLFCDE